MNSTTIHAKRYRVIWIRFAGRVEDGREVSRGVHCPGPFTHEEACTVLRKMAPHPWRRDQIEEIETVELKALRVVAEKASAVYRAWDEERSHVNKMLAMGTALAALKKTNA